MVIIDYNALFSEILGQRHGHGPIIRPFTRPDLGPGPVILPPSCEGVTCPDGESCQLTYCTPPCPPHMFCIQSVRICGTECVPTPTTDSTATDTIESSTG